MEAKTTAQKPPLIARSALAAALMAGMLLVLPITPARAAYSSAGYALDFNGTDEYVQVPDDVSLDANLGDSFTVEAWIRTREDDNSMIFAKHSGGSSGSYYFATFSGDWLDFTVITSSGRQDHTVSYAYNDGKWHHVAGVYDGSDLWIYVDGVQIGGTTAQSGSVNDTNYPVRIGYYAGTPDWFYDGIYDEIRLWDDARTVAEIRANMYKELSGSEAGLVAYYKMSDGSGTTLTDDSTNSNTGTLVNMGDSNWITSGAFAGPRNALDFDGVDDFVDLGNPPELQITGNLTVETWFKTTLAVADYKQLVAKWYSGGDLDGGSYVVGWGGTGLNFSIQNASQQGLSASSGAMWNDGEWHHVAGTWDGTTIKIYIDGALQDSTTNAGFGSIEHTSRTVRIGSDNRWTTYPNDRQFAGQIDEVRIWNTARTPAQIRDDMYRTLDGDESGLVAYYRFDQYNTSGQTTLYDITSNGNNGALTNMDATSDWVSSSAFNTWVGSTSTDWATASNWSTGSAPGASDNIGVYSYTGGNNPTVGGSVTVDRLVVTTGAMLTVSGSGNLAVSSMDFVNGSVTRSSGAVTQEDRTISGTGVLTYGLAAATVDVQTLGSLSSLQMMRTESAHAQENANGGGANILDRYYTLTPNGSPGSFSVEICLDYTDAELGGLNESNLRLCRWTGSGWTCPDRGTRSNTTDNLVCAENVTTFSDWTMGEVDSEGGPTAVTLASFTATPQDDGILVEWETALELSNVGFNLYRSTSAEGPYVRLNAALIPGQAPGSIFGAAYTWLDKEVQPGITYYYKLEDVETSDARAMYGPVSSTIQNPTKLTLVSFKARRDNYAALVMAGMLFLCINGLVGRAGSQDPKSLKDL
jgi:hypothetical protein